MGYFLQNCGIFGWLVLIILGVNVVLFFVSAGRIRNADPEENPKIAYGINAILFWGAVCALLGFLGQYSGIYISLQVVKSAAKVSPTLLAEGIAISFTTTIMGMIALLLSAIAWFALHSWYKSRVGPA